MGESVSSFESPKGGGGIELYGIMPFFFKKKPNSRLEVSAHASSGENCSLSIFMKIPK
jgi:hypothetical protein